MVQSSQGYRTRPCHKQLKMNKEENKWMVNKIPDMIFHMLIPSTGEVVAGRQWAKLYLYSLSLMRYYPNKLKIDETILIMTNFLPRDLGVLPFPPKIIYNTKVYNILEELKQNNTIKLQQHKNY